MKTEEGEERKEVPLIPCPPHMSLQEPAGGEKEGLPPAVRTRGHGTGRRAQGLDTEGKHHNSDNSRHRVLTTGLDLLHTVAQNKDFNT